MILLWAIICCGSGAYLVVQAVPLWFRLHHEQLLVVTSGSMEPAFAAGDAVVLRTITNPSDLRVGQVVTFWPVTGKSMVTHRITRMMMLSARPDAHREGDTATTLSASGDTRLMPYIMTKGDANRTEDPNATPVSQVRGIVLSAHPHWGLWLHWVDSSLGRFALLGPAVGALIALEVTSLVGSWRRRARVSQVRSRVETQVDRWSAEVLSNTHANV